MRLKHSYAIIAIAVVCMLAGCQSRDLDVNNIDMTAELNMGVALPMGSIHFTVGDFFNSEVSNFYVDTTDNKGILTWKDTFTIAKNFHQVDLAQYLTEKKVTLNFYDKIHEAFPAIPIIGENITLPGTGTQIKDIEFNLPLKLTGINHPDSIARERLDSARIEMASFSSLIAPVNFNFQWEWIDEVKLDLGEQIRRDEGNTVVIYQKGRDSYAFNEMIPTNVDKFSIHMLKQGTPPGIIQVVDTCNFKILISFTIPVGESVTFSPNSGLDYTMGVRFIDYSAIWGRYSRSKDMADENLVDLAGAWEGVDFIHNSNVPFADPKVDMHIVTQVAGALKIDGDYLYTIDSHGVKHEATFKRGDQTYKNFPRQFEDGEYLHPTKSQIGDSTTNMIIRFDKSEEKGHIDRLFENMPMKLGYKFGVDFNYESKDSDGKIVDQIRITPNTSIRIDAVFTLPLDFGQGMHLEYADTIKNLDINQFRIDSLIGSSNVVKSTDTKELKLIIRALNEIPLDLKVYLRCLDEKGNIIKDPNDTTMPLTLIEGDTLLLEAPNFIQDNTGQWIPQQAQMREFVVSIPQYKLDKFPDIKNIVYFAFIDNSTLDAAYEKGMKNVPITNKQGLTLSLGLSANIGAVLNLNGINNPSNSGDNTNQQ